MAIEKLDPLNWASRPYEKPQVGTGVLDSLSRLRRHCKTPLNEAELRRLTRLEELNWELMELFSLPSAKHAKGLRDIFRLVDNREDRAVLFSMREYLRGELGQMQERMNKDLKKSSMFDPVLRAEMDLILRSDIMLSRAYARKEMNQSEIKESLKGSCIIPRAELKGYGLRHVDHVSGSMCFHVCYQTCGESR
jgi:hypothetical protein